MKHWTVYRLHFRFSLIILQPNR